MKGRRISSAGALLGFNPCRPLIFMGTEESTSSGCDQSSNSIHKVPKDLIWCNYSFYSVLQWTFVCVSYLAEMKACNYATHHLQIIGLLLLTLWGLDRSLTLVGSWYPVHENHKQEWRPDTSLSPTPSINIFKLTPWIRMQLSVHTYRNRMLCSAASSTHVKGHWPSLDPQNPSQY